MYDAAALARAIDAEASALVATLPGLPDVRLAALIDDAAALAAMIEGEAAVVASTLARLVQQYRDGRAVLAGWAFVASAAHTLARAVADPADGQAAALAAVRFELETLLPSTGAAAPSLVAPDVPIASLVRPK